MKKFLVIQIDGLSHDRLLDACHKGYCPALSMLIKERHLHRYNCGLPSNTPFAQAGLMFGHNEHIPGFRFVDKKLRKQFSVNNPLKTRLIELTYLSKYQGILKDGRSIVNLFSGGADESRLTNSMLYQKDPKAFLAQFDIFLFLLYPRVLAAVASRGILHGATYLQYLYENFWNKVEHLANPSDFKYNVTSFFSSVFFEELETKAMIKEMRKKTPYLYVTFNGYDECSHHQGPSSPAAYEALASIDKKMARIFAQKQDYDIYILSDHGHTESVPFRQLYGIGFKQFVRQELGHYRHARDRYFRKKHQQADIVDQFFLKPLVNLEHAYHYLFSKSFKSLHQQLHWNSHPYFLEVSDPMANLYFTFTDEKADMSEVERHYPGFLDTLRSHPGIGFVFGKEGDYVKVISRDGTAYIGTGDADHHFIGERFLRNYGDEFTLTRQLRYFGQMENSGDLIIFGDYSKGNVISFINHFGSHGSAGGEQMHPFFLSPEKHDLSGVINSAQLHPLFMRYHLLNAQEAEQKKFYENAVVNS
ncbi:MAG: alkaline phosphatase family protein [Nanoarchaeota archaeon]